MQRFYKSASFSFVFFCAHVLLGQAVTGGGTSTEYFPQPFSIVQNGQPFITSTVTDFSLLAACSAELDTSIVLQNAGTADLTILSFSFSGKDSLSFSRDPLRFPFVIPPGVSVRIPFSFVPSGLGTYSSVLEVFSDAVNTPDQIYRVNIAARRESAQFTISSNPVDFGTFLPGTAADTVIYLTNTGTLPLQWNAPVALDEFTITSIIPAVTAPGATSAVKIHFAGVATDWTVTRHHEFIDTICGNRIPLDLKASVRSQPGTPVATLGTPILRAAPGDTVAVPVWLHNAHYLETQSITGFAATLRFNSSLLFPILNTPPGSVANGERAIPLQLPATAGADSVLVTLLFRATLGTDTTTALTLDQAVAIGGSAVMNTVDGRFSLTGSCGIGVTRLIVVAPPALLKPATPNPASAVTNVGYHLSESGYARLVLTNLRGEVVQTLFDNVNAVPGDYSATFDATQLPSGMYFCVLETASGRLNRRVEVVH